MSCLICQMLLENTVYKRRGAGRAKHLLNSAKNTLSHQQNSEKNDLGIELNVNEGEWNEAMPVLPVQMKS